MCLSLVVVKEMYLWVAYLVLDSGDIVGLYSSFANRLYAVEGVNRIIV